MITIIINIHSALLLVLFGNNLLKSYNIAALFPINLAFSVYSFLVNYFLGGVHIIYGSKNSTYNNAKANIIPLPIGAIKKGLTVSESI